MNLDGVRAVGKVFQKEFAAIGFKTKWIEMPKGMNRAGHLLASYKGSKGIQQ